MTAPIKAIEREQDEENVPIDREIDVFKRCQDRTSPGTPVDSSSRDYPTRTSTGSLFASFLFPMLIPTRSQVLAPSPYPSSISPPVLSTSLCYRSYAPLEAVKIMSGFSELVAMAVTHPPCPSRDPL